MNTIYMALSLFILLALVCIPLEVLLKDFKAGTTDRSETVIKWARGINLFTMGTLLVIGVVYMLYFPELEQWVTMAIPVGLLSGSALQTMLEIRKEFEKQNG